MCIPKLTFRLLEPLGVFLANFKCVLQCSCPSSLRTVGMFSKLFSHFPTTALHLPRRCRLVSYSSPQTGHIGSSFIFSKVRRWFNVLCAPRAISGLWTVLLNDTPASHADTVHHLLRLWYICYCNVQLQNTSDKQVFHKRCRYLWMNILVEDPVNCIQLLRASATIFSSRYSISCSPQ